MSADTEYKLAKEKFYQGHTGGSSLEVVSITSLPPISVCLAQIISLCWFGYSVGNNKRRSSDLRDGLLSMLCITLPTYASFVAPELSTILAIGQIIVALACLWVTKAKIRGAKQALEVSYVHGLILPVFLFFTSHRQ
jgi:hypothetical protein